MAAGWRECLLRAGMALSPRRSDPVSQPPGSNGAGNLRVEDSAFRQQVHADAGGTDESPSFAAGGDAAGVE